MTDSITMSDLRNALTFHVETLERVGITYDGRLGIDEGSKLYGRAFRLYRVPTGHSGHHNPPVGRDFLGMTKREAYETLQARTWAIIDTVYALEQSGRLA